MSLVLSPLARALAQQAIVDALDGGALHLLSNGRELVKFTFGSPAFNDDGKASIQPAYGLAKGSPDSLRCVTKAGEVIATGPSTVTLTPAVVIPGALVTVDGLTLTAK